MVPIQQCADRAVGTIAVGHPQPIRDDEDLGRHGNKRLRDWAFETLIQYIEYKAEERGIDVARVDEYSLHTSKTCCECGTEADSNRVERGLYVYETCELVANSDITLAIPGGAGADGNGDALDTWGPAVGIVGALGIGAGAYRYLKRD